MIASRSSGDRASFATRVATAAACAAFAAGAAAPAFLDAAAAAGRSSCATSVTIAGKRTCLVAGKSCKRKYETKYKSKGFTCKRTATGSYRLKKVPQTF